MGDVKGREVVFKADPTNESIIVAAAIAGGERSAAFRKVACRHAPDSFLVAEYAAIWKAIREAEHRNLPPDPATLARLSHGAIDLNLVTELMTARPDVPADETLEFALGQLAWDRQKHIAVTGPIDLLLQALQSGEGPERCRGLANAVKQSFDGWGDRRYLHDPAELVRDQVTDLRARQAGLVAYPFGLPGLDFYETKSAGETPVRRVVVGAAPALVTIVTGWSGSGKALALDTPIATCDGWTTMGKIRRGEFIFDERGESCRVTWCSDVMVERECYEVVFSDGERIVADADHLWKTQSEPERRAEIRLSPEWHESRRAKRNATRRPAVSATLLAANRKVLNPEGAVRTTRQIAESLVSRNSVKNHAIRLTGPLVLPDADLPIDPYVLGAWLGDGTSSAGSITTADCDEEIVDRICLAFYRIRKTSSKYRWAIYGLVPQLRELGVLGKKHIPQEYLRASTAQRLELLRGLMDTDGSRVRSGGCEFTTTSKRLAAGFGELLTTLGIHSHACEGLAKLKGRIIGPKWRFTFTTAFDVFHLRRKRAGKRTPSRGTCERRYVVDVRKVPSVPVRCIMVDSPSHLFLAGRGMVPTHNSTVAARLCLGLARQGRHVLYGAWEPRGGPTLELLACMSLNLSRSRMHQKGALTEEQIEQVRARMLAIGGVDQPAERGWVRFMGNPFGRVHGAKESNERNLDVLQGYIADSGCDVFVADLFERCIADDRPSEEKRALFRAQAMFEEQSVHGILLAQQGKVMEGMRPTMAGIKGSGGWYEIGDNIFGIHRPYLFKPVPDNVLEIDLLKQRDGVAPLAVEFDWDPDRGMISGGRSIEYERQTRGGETTNGIDSMLRDPKPKKDKR